MACKIEDGKCVDYNRGQMGKRCYVCPHFGKSRTIPIPVAGADYQLIHDIYKQDADYSEMNVEAVVIATAARFWEMGINSLKRHVKEA